MKKRITIETIVSRLKETINDSSCVIYNNAFMLKSYEMLDHMKGVGVSFVDETAKEIFNDLEILLSIRNMNILNEKCPEFYDKCKKTMENISKNDDKLIAYYNDKHKPINEHFQEYSEEQPAKIDGETITAVSGWISAIFVILSIVIVIILVAIGHLKFEEDVKLFFLESIPLIVPLIVSIVAGTINRISKKKRPDFKRQMLLKYKKKRALYGRDPLNIFDYIEYSNDYEKYKVTLSIVQTINGNKNTQKNENVININKQDVAKTNPDEPTDSQSGNPINNTIDQTISGNRNTQINKNIITIGSESENASNVAKTPPDTSEAQPNDAERWGSFYSILNKYSAYKNNRPDAKEEAYVVYETSGNAVLVSYFEKNKSLSIIKGNAEALLCAIKNSGFYCTNLSNIETEGDYTKYSFTASINKQG